MKHRIRILSILLLLLGIGINGHCGTPPRCLFSHYTTEQGLSNNAVFRILCDSKGFVWFFTWNGISRYDGYRFVNYGTAQQTPLVHNRIDRGFEDRYSNFWLVTYTRNLYRFNRRTEEFENIDRFLPEGIEPNIFRVEEAPDGTVWATLPDFGIVGFSTDPETLELTPSLFPIERSRAITQIYPDASGLVWFTCDNQLFSVSAGEHSVYCDMTLDSASVISIEGDSEKVCFGTTDGRLIVRDARSQSFSEYRLPENTPITTLKLPNDGTNDILIGTGSGELHRFDGTGFQRLAQCGTGSIQKIKTDSHGLIWVGPAGQGLYKYDPATGLTRFFSQGTRENLTGKNNSRVSEHNGQTWITLNGGGIMWYDRETDRAYPLLDEQNTQGIPTGSACTSYCFDRGDNLWFTTTNRGITRVRFIDAKVHLLPLHGARPGRMLFVDKNDRLWVALKTGGLLRYETDRQNYKNFTHDDEGRPLDAVYAMSQETDSLFWLGTKTQGLCKAVMTPDGKLHITRYAYDPNDLYSLSNNKVHTVLLDSRGRLWIGTFGGGICLAIRDGDRLRFLSQRNLFSDRLPESCRKVRSLCEAADGRIWAATSDGVLIADYDPTTQQLLTEHLRRAPAEESTLRSNDITCLFRDSANRMWAGTFGGGIGCYTGKNPATGAAQWHSYVESGDRFYNDILSIVEDAAGTLWISTDTQICALYPEADLITPLTLQDGIQADEQFAEHTAACDHEGRIYIGELEKIYGFHPDSFADSDKGMNLQIVGFEIDERPIVPSTEPNAPLQVAISEAQEVRIGAGYHLFGFEFAAVNCRMQRHVRYRHILEGYDKDWTDDRGTRKTLYANIPGGTYLFRVRAFGPQSTGTYDERTIRVIVESSFWSSWRSMTLAATVIALVIGFGLAYRNIYRRTLQKRRVIKISPDEIALRDTPDEQFMTVVTNYMEKHYADPNLKIDDLTRLTHMSRSSFYNRIKELTQMPPNEYLKHFRLRKAEMYLTETRLAISEIAYKTGFTDPAYFSSCFRSRYGITPSAYRRQNERE
ncbi:MAG: helix-turn-helix domain-containing protein [Alistipes sp.]|nr:helix-turn-helix domain-containing protein [Alistipes sp.]